MKRINTILAVMLFAVIFAGCSEPLTTREKGAIGVTLGGAALGGIIGAAAGNAGVGAGVGAGLGLLTGAYIGDQMQAREKQDEEVERQQRELDQLRRQQAR